MECTGEPGRGVGTLVQECRRGQERACSGVQAWQHKQGSLLNKSDHGHLLDFDYIVDVVVYDIRCMFCDIIYKLIQYHRSISFAISYTI